MPALHWFVTEIDPKNAGYRVRTMPIVAELRAQGVEVELHTTSELPSLVKSLVRDALAVVVSKPADSLTFLCLGHLRANGVPAVADLFDNYFSWSPGILQRQIHWQWLRALQSASLIVSSSDFLGAVIRSLTPKPITLIGDLVPAPPEPCPRELAGADKWDAPERIELLWFGIAGNPYYIAGLEDLLRWTQVIRNLARRTASRVSLRLTICTNRVPAVEAVLLALRSEQVEARYIEWSEPVCDALLTDSHVVLLPTNLSGFSLSKTHNRCSDALARRCLVLASPQGPYRGIGGAVFDDPELLAAALGRITSEGVQSAVRQSYLALRERHDLASDVGRFRTALEAVRSTAVVPGKAGPPPVLIASRTRGEVPKLSRTMGYLVAGFADGPMELNYDLRLERLDGFDHRATLSLSERARKAVDLLISRRSVDPEDLGEWIGHRIGSWKVLVHRDSGRLSVANGLPEQALQALFRAQEEGRRGSMARQAPWFDAHVDVLTRILRKLGFKRQELASEDEGGWPVFAANADPELAELAARLEDQWRRFFGRESTWGRPLEEAA